MNEVSRGLIIAQPWIGKILSGEKVWEMRSSHTSIRGPVALIEKGTGVIVGVATIVDSVGPLSFDEIFENEERHWVGPEIYTKEDYKWNHAWVLGEVIHLSEPVQYQHKNGAVIWVELDGYARSELLARLNISGRDLALNSSVDESEDVNSPESKSSIPFARDGSWFCEKVCNRGGYYAVGEKGSEQRFSDYQRALEYLRAMPTAKWRRPNKEGNWGIVSAVRWDIS
jgi:hypothetical protein